MAHRQTSSAENLQPMAVPDKSGMKTKPRTDEPARSQTPRFYSTWQTPSKPRVNPQGGKNIFYPAGNMAIFCAPTVGERSESHEGESNSLSLCRGRCAFGLLVAGSRKISGIAAHPQPHRKLFAGGPLPWRVSGCSFA